MSGVRCARSGIWLPEESESQTEELSGETSGHPTVRSWPNGRLVRVILSKNLSAVDTLRFLNCASESLPKQ